MGGIQAAVALGGLAAHGGAQLAEGAGFCGKCGCPAGEGQTAASPGGAPTDSARTMTLLALIFQSVAAVALFMPGIYKEIYWKRGPGALDPYTKLWEKAVSFFGGTPEGWASWDI